MASLANTIYRFQNGDLTNQEFLAQIDRLLANDEANSDRLKALLEEERTRTLIPPEVYDDLRQRVGNEAAPDRGRTDGKEVVQDETHSHRNRSLPRSWQGVQAPEDAGGEGMKAVGDVLNGRFVLEECIGFGGMGMVYKALDLRKLEASDRNPYIAIKVLNVQFRGHPKSLIALQREAKKAQTLAHPNIVTVYDFDRDGATVFLTMEYLDGKPLSHMLQSPQFNGMSWTNAMRIVNGMARALAYAHERGFVHCDFKPANVILTEKGEVKVIDFGIARAIHKPTEEAEVTVFDPGSLGGLTPAYASTEMLEHRDPDPRDDIYALGCITYELLTGHHPFDRLTATQARNAGMKPTRPRQIGHTQWRALKTAMAFEREARTPTVARFLKDLGVERSDTHSVPVLAASALLGLLLAGGATWFWLSDSADVQDQPVAASADQATSSPPAASPTFTVPEINRLLADVPCSAMIAASRDGSLRVSGYLPSAYGIERLKALLGNPAATALSLDVQQVSDDKCGVINLFAPYWRQHRHAGGGATIHTRPREARLQDGDRLMLDITTPAYQSFVNVDYYSFDGNVVHLVPSPRSRANHAPAGYSATLGGLNNWVVTKPFGTDLIVLLATPVPLFDPMRPQIEKTAGYLDEVEKRLKQLSRGDGKEKIAVDFLQVTTSARKP